MKSTRFMWGILFPAQQNSLNDTAFYSHFSRQTYPFETYVSLFRIKMPFA